MRSAILALGALGAGCGGSAPPKETTPEPPPPPQRTIIEASDGEEEPVEEGVSFTSKRGRMDIAAVEAGIAPHKEAMAACYTDNLNRRRWLGGNVILHWEIKKDGTIAELRIDGSEPGTDLGNWTIEKCILEVARQASFGKPIGGDADFTIPMKFDGVGRIMNWDADQTLRAVGGQTAKLAKCAKGKAVAPKQPVTITVYVGPRGKAQSVGFTGSVVDEAWADCAEKTALGWRLPDPKGTIAKLAVTYPRD